MCQNFSVPVMVHLPKNWKQRATYELLEDECIHGHNIPKGFISDGATVPRCFWPIFPPVGKYFRAALVHDYYLIKGMGWTYANDAFINVLRFDGVSRTRTFLLYTSVWLWSKYKIYFKGERK